MAEKQNMFGLAQLGDRSSQSTPSLNRHHGTHTAIGPYPSRSTSQVPLTAGERTARRREKRKAQTPVSSPSIPPTSDENMLSEDDFSDSETVRKALHCSDPEIPDPGMPSSPAEIPSNVLIDTSTRDIDSLMHPPSDAEAPPTTAPPTTTSVASQPDTVNQLQRLHNYIDSRLLNLVGVAVEQAVGARCDELADTLNKEIVSIRNRVLQPAQDEDDRMPEDQPNGDPADGDDECEEGSKNCRQNRPNRRKNNHHKRQQAANDDNDDEEDEEDENDSGGRRRKAPIVLTVALRAFLQRKGLMIKEVSGLPAEPLPPCAPDHEVRHYEDGISRVGPDPFNIQYFWPGALGGCKWNKQATAHLASEYHDLFREEKIRHNGHVLPYDSTIPVKDFENKIRIRLQRTQLHWKNANRPQNNPHNTDVPTPLELASLRMKENRFRRRGAKLLERRKKVAEKYISDQQLKEQVLSMLESLGNGGMNSPLSDCEDSVDKELQRCEHFWLSTEILSLFEVLDLIEKRAINSRLKTRRGNRPLRINNKPAKRVLDSSATRSLPKNWYREEWYNHLDLYQKSDLNAAEIESLPDIEKIREIVEG